MHSYCIVWIAGLAELLLSNLVGHWWQLSFRVITFYKRQPLILLHDLNEQCLDGGNSQFFKGLYRHIYCQASREMGGFIYLPDNYWVISKEEHLIIADLTHIDSTLYQIKSHHFFNISALISEGHTVSLQAFFPSIWW